jgi:hypothetical protein
MRTSDQINEISAALAKAQGEIQNPAKEAQNPHFRSTYADLSGGINAIRDGLSKNGIAFIQSTRLDGDILIVDSRLSHASGQWVESEFPACKFPAKPQEIGSALTYARRYALFALVGIAGEDDDGNAANNAETPARPRREAPERPRLLDPGESQIVRSDMLEALAEAASSRESLLKWAQDNSAMKARLQKADADAVGAAFTQAQAALKQPKQEAAE